MAFGSLRPMLRTRPCSTSVFCCRRCVLHSLYVFGVPYAGRRVNVFTSTFALNSRVAGHTIGAAGLNDSSRCVVVLSQRAAPGSSPVLSPFCASLMTAVALGKSYVDMTKLQMVEVLADDLSLEAQVLPFTCSVCPTACYLLLICVPYCV
jgi:hypothetical protein